MRDDERQGSTTTTWRHYDVSKRSIYVYGGASALYLVVLALLPADLFGMSGSATIIWGLLFGVPVFLFSEIFIGRNVRRQREERKKLGQRIHSFSRISRVIFWVGYGLYILASNQFNVPYKSQNLLNKLFRNPDSNPPGTIETMLWIFLVVVAPMLILALIFFGPQLLRQRKVRKKEGSRRAANSAN